MNIFFRTAILFFLTPLFFPGAVLAQQVGFLSDFETGGIQDRGDTHDGWSIQGECPPSMGGNSVLKIMQRDGNIVPRAGNYMARMNVRYNDPWGYNGGNCVDRARVQIRKRGEPSPNGTFDRNKEYWLGVSIFLPASYARDSQELVMSLLEQGSSDFSGITVRTWGGDWFMDNELGRNCNLGRDAEGQCRRDKKAVFRTDHMSDRGKWTDWVINVKFAPSGGFIRAYKNGELVGQRNGPTISSDKIDQIQLMLRMYKASWRSGPSDVTERTIYFDEIRLAQCSGSHCYDLVAPPGAAPCQEGCEGGGGSGSGSDGGSSSDGSTTPPPTCIHRITNSSHWNSLNTVDFAPPYNILSSQRELMIQISCGGPTVTARVGTGNQQQYIYNTGYYWGNNGQWNPVHLSGMTIGDHWLIGQGSGSFPASAVTLGTNNFFLAYVCAWSPQENRWKCGCRDNTCTTGYWNLQVYR